MGKNIQKFEVISHVDEVTKAMEEALEEALVTIGMKAEAYAKLKAPVDTGTLRNSINWATSEGNGVGEGRDEPKATPEEAHVYIGTNVEYAERQELGHYKHKVGFSPYLRPALEEHTDEYKNIVQDYLEGKRV